MLNGLEFVSYLIEARKVNLLIKRHPPNDCTFLVSEIGLGRSNHHAFLSFEQQALFEDHSQHTFDRWRRPARDGQSGLPSTTLDYVSFTELSPT